MQGDESTTGESPPADDSTRGSLGRRSTLWTVALVASFLTADVLLTWIYPSADPPSGYSLDNSLTVDGYWYSAEARSWALGGEASVSDSYRKPLWSLPVYAIYHCFGVTFESTRLLSSLASLATIALLTITLVRHFGYAAAIVGGGWLVASPSWHAYVRSRSSILGCRFGACSASCSPARDGLSAGGSGRLSSRSSLELSSPWRSSHSPASRRTACTASSPHGGFDTRSPSRWRRWDSAPQECSRPSGTRRTFSVDCAGTSEDSKVRRSRSSAAYSRSKNARCSFRRAARVHRCRHRSSTRSHDGLPRAGWITPIPAHGARQLCGRSDPTLDGGICSASLPSTVVPAARVRDRRLCSRRPSTRSIAEPSPVALAPRRRGNRRRRHRAVGPVAMRARSRVERSGQRRGGRYGARRRHRWRGHLASRPKAYRSLRSVQSPGAREPRPTFAFGVALAVALVVPSAPRWNLTPRLSGVLHRVRRSRALGPCGPPSRNRSGRSPTF